MLSAASRQTAVGRARNIMPVSKCRRVPLVQAKTSAPSDSLLALDVFSSTANNRSSQHRLRTIRDEAASRDRGPADAVGADATSRHLAMGMGIGVDVGRRSGFRLWVVLL
jgi:hypothetical protein